MVDRLKRMINVSGYNVWPAEVESALRAPGNPGGGCHQHTRRAHRRGRKAVVVLREEEKGKANSDDIVEWAKSKMADYKYPRSVEFIDELPKSGSGKILWRELQEREQAKIGEAP